MLKSISIPVFLLFSISAFSQTENSQKILMEQEIDQLIITINNIPDINRKFKLNDSIYSLLDTLILKKSLFHDRLDSIKNLRMVYSPDSCFRILTWYFLPSPDTYFYNGIFQYNNSTMNGSKSNLFHLKDYSDQMKNPDLFIGTDTSWYGSIYYDIILKEFNGIKYYVLLGYDYNSLISRKKIIDVLTIQNGNIYFGAHIFTWPDRILSRVIFEFSCSAGMTLCKCPTTTFTSPLLR